MPLKTEAGRDRWAKMSEDQRDAANRRRQEWRRRRSKLRPPVAKREHVLVELYCRPSRQRFFGITAEPIAQWWAACQFRATHRRRARTRRSDLLRAIAEHGADAFRLKIIATFKTQAGAMEAVRERRSEQERKLSERKWK